MLNKDVIEELISRLKRSDITRVCLLVGNKTSTSVVISTHTLGLAEMMTNAAVNNPAYLAASCMLLTTLSRIGAENIRREVVDDE